MSIKFWEGVGSKLAERLAAVAVPAIAFWLGGLVAWTLGSGGIDTLQEPVDWFSQRSGPIQAAILLLILLSVAGSGLVVARFAAPTLALLEGYWPRFMQPVRQRLIDRVARQAEKAQGRFQELAGPIHDGSASAEQRDEYTQLSRRLRRLPTSPRLLPTHVGNTLRAAETRPIDKYGLDAVALWPHLWLVLPATTRNEISAARRSLDTAVEVSIWGVLFVGFAPFTLWALPLGVAVVSITVLAWIPTRAEVFADLLEAAFDLHRTELYRQLRWPLPRNPAEEPPSGRRLTTYLMRGLSGTVPAFTGGDAAAAAARTSDDDK